MKKNLTTVVGTLLALALVASACGGGGSNDQALIDAIAAQMNEDGDVPPGVDVTCMSAAMVDAFGGADVMEEEFGLTAESVAGGAEPDDIELGVDDARAMTDELLACGLDDAMVNLIAGDRLSEEAAACLRENLDDDAIRDLLAADFMSSEDGGPISDAAEQVVGASLFDSIATCDISPADLDF